jgi:predicted N-acetyltransferase YhbS
MKIRHAQDSDLQAISAIHMHAFGADEGPVIVELVHALLRDETANPVLSLVAELEGKPVAHVLFTHASIQEEQQAFTVSLLAPLAVLPAFQGKGIGSALINEGLELLRESGVDLVFVLGHPAYYPRCGFHPAGVHGLDAPYPIPAEHADAWMVQALRPNLIDSVSGKVICADALDKPEYWRE